MTIETIKSNINTWNDIRNSDLGLKFLTSGYAIELSREEFDKWNLRLKDKKGISIHLYIGVSQDEIAFYLVDSETDKTGTYSIGDNLFIKAFTRTIEGVSGDKDIQNIAIDESLAINRIFKWFFSASQWFYKQTAKSPLYDEGGVVRVFTIPFNDYQQCFQSDESKALMLFGLRNYFKDGKHYYDEIEVLVCSESEGLIVNTKNESLQFADVTTPRPPFSTDGQGLNLL